MNVSKQTRRAVTVAFASICLAAGCSDAGLIDNGPAAAAPAASSNAPIAGESTAPSALAAPVLPVVPSLPPPPALPALDELLADERFLPLAIALERSGLDDVIDGLDDFVLLAPTGAAFESAGTDVGIDYLTMINQPRLLESVIRYQIIADPSINESWRTLNGAALDVKGTDPDLIDRVNGVAVTERIPVRGGTVLVVPRLLLPESPPVGSQPVGSQPPGDD
jgi:uncharacterized surface protein with fasciclin (FAS1) repeats